MAALLGLPNRGVFLPANFIHKRFSFLHRRAGGNIWPRADLHDLPDAGGGRQTGNNTRYGLAASIWTENINLALDIAPKIKAGTVWINCTNVFDAASGFGGYQESGFGREGGREGLWEYVKPKWESEFSEIPSHEKPKPPAAVAEAGFAMPAIDRTAKLYIGGKQARPDSGYSTPVYNPAGQLITEVGAGNRKDIRNAVEAAHAAAGWTSATAHNRAQVLF